MTLRKGDTGSAVRDLQKRLGLEADGWYGDETEAAVRAFQEKSGLVVDGIAGDKTIAAVESGSIGKGHLTHADVVAAAEDLGCDLCAVLAVNEVESLGGGFLSDGRPKILFERHVMYQRLEAAGQDAATLAEKYPNIINQKRGGYAGGPAEWARLATAGGIDRNCAIESASWGLFQIMGYHWQILGYDSAEAFSSTMHRSEADQLQAFTRFIKANPPIHKALKARKWADFAKLYNGPAYKENLYDAKLAVAYERHAAAEAA